MSPRVPVLVIACAVPLRLALDLLWWAPGVGGVSPGQLGSGLLAVLLVGLVGVRPGSIRTHPLRWSMAAVAVVILMGVSRADAVRPAVVHGAHLGLPLLWLAALWAWRPPLERVAAPWLVAAFVPVGLGLAAAVLGQPLEAELHGWPRLLGAYGTLHTHAGVMAVLTVAGAAVGASGRRWGWVLAVGALVCLTLTFVRTAWLFAAFAAMGVAMARGRWRVALVLAVAGAGAAVASGRLGDLWSVLTLTPPEGGWARLGSSRGHIWGDSLQTFLAGPAADVWLGRGLGGQMGLHRHLDPHSELLSLLYQFGPLGPVVWLAWAGHALVELWRRARSPGSGGWAAALGFGLVLGCILTAPLSNDLLTRATVVLLVGGCVGLGLGATRWPASGAPAGPADAATPPPPAA